jgi:hypothetical protein
MPTRWSLPNDEIAKLCRVDVGMPRLLSSGNVHRNLLEIQLKCSGSELGWRGCICAVPQVT